MAVIAFVEKKTEEFKKADFELTSYAKELADAMGTECTVLVIGAEEGEVRDLGAYGADKLVVLDHDLLKDFDSGNYTQAIAEAYEAFGGEVLLMLHHSTGKSLAGRLAVRLGAGIATGVNGLPDLGDGFVVPRPVFAGKAIAKVKITTANKLVSLMPNSLAPKQYEQETQVVRFVPTDLQEPKVAVVERKTQSGIVPLPEAERVVSAGRGMKGPENWGIVEELAKVLGATTACSRPVADSDWRPHHEHVGQTGIAIRPNLYIAIGISGAIQHLAGVNNSKVIVVINKDPEAPFFKAADYGVCGDLFEVVPRFTEALKRFYANN